jgi:voltage-gated potassium channel Kch
MVLSVPETRNRWREFEESADAYRAVTLLLVLLIVVPIVTQPAWELTAVVTAILAGAAATLALAASDAHRWATRTSILAWAAAVVGTALPWVSDRFVALAMTILGLLMIAAPVVIIRRIGGHSKVTATTMWGAVSAYLSVGIAFSFIYAAIASVDAAAFTPSLGQGLGDANYFSFVTMTTLGYGDIAPASDPSRGLVVLETVVGQIFLVIVVARVVSLLGTDRKLRTRPDRHAGPATLEESDTAG